MGIKTRKKSKKVASQAEDAVEKPKAKRRTRKTTIIPDPLPEQTPPLPDSP
jgi:hypothetical protein